MWWHATLLLLLPLDPSSFVSCSRAPALLRPVDVLKRQLSLSVTAAATTAASTLIYSVASAAPFDTRPRALVCPGYRIPPACYEEISSALSVCNSTVVQVAPISGVDESIQESSANIRSELIELSSGALTLFGHSRGGSVCVDAALRLQPTKALTSLILLDPVDDAQLSTLSLLDAAAGVTLALPPTLLLSTPWAGSSTYYKTRYEPACAPPRRSAPTYARLLRRGGQPFLYLTLPNMGHLSLLSKREDLSALANVCGSTSSPKLSSSQFQQLRMLLLELTVAWSRGQSVDTIISNIKEIDGDVTVMSYN